MTGIPPAKRRPDPQLVGRDRELALVDQALADQDGFRSVVFAGEDGAGKTALLTAAGNRARDRGWTPVTVTATEDATGLPYGLLGQLLSGPPLAEAEQRLSATHRALLTDLHPTGRQPATAPSALLDQAGLDRYQWHRAVRALTEAAAADQPLVLALDDLHLTDTATLETLTYLAGHPPTGPVLLLVGYDPRSATDQLDQLLALLATEPVTVPPLTEKETAALLPHRSPAELAALQLTSGGNPLCLSLLDRCGRPGPPAPQPLPDLVAELLDRLPPAGREAVLAAAAHGEPFDAAVLARLLDQPPAQVADLLDQDLTELLTPDGHGGYRLRDPALRTLLRTLAPAGLRSRAHQLRARQAAAEGLAPDRYAHHVCGSAEPGDRAAAQLLERAARSVMVRDPRSAVRWLRTALELLPEGAERRHAAVQLRLRIAQGLATLGRLEECRDTLRTVLTVLAPGSRRRPRVATWCATVERMLGRHPVARQLLVSELELLPDQVGRDAAELRLALTADALLGGRYDSETHEHGVLALAIARRHRDEALEAASAAVVAHTHILLGDPRQAETAADDAAYLLDALPDPVAAQRLGTFAFLVSTENYLQRPSAARQHARRALQLARAAGQGYIQPYLQLSLALSYFGSGQLAEAKAWMDDALCAAELLGSVELLTLARTAQGEFALILEDPRTALAAAEQALSTGDGTGDGRWVRRALMLRSAAWLLIGDPRGRLADITDHAGGPNLVMLDPWSRSHWWENIARIAATVGDGATATAWADAAQTRAQHIGHTRARVFAYLARAHALRGVDPAGEARFALATAEEADRVGMLLVAARARFYAGQALAAIGHCEQAVLVLEQAARSFALCGAHVFGRRAAEALAVLRPVPDPG